MSNSFNQSQPVHTSDRIWPTMSFETAKRTLPPSSWIFISRKSLLICDRSTASVFPRSWVEKVDPAPFFISANIFACISGVIELSYTKMKEDHFIVSVVFRSIKICSRVDVASTSGDKIEVEKRDLGQPSPTS